MDDMTWKNDILGMQEMRWRQQMVILISQSLLLPLYSRRLLILLVGSPYFNNDGNIINIIKIIVV